MFRFLIDSRTKRLIKNRKYFTMTAVNIQGSEGRLHLNLIVFPYIIVTGAAVVFCGAVSAERWVFYMPIRRGGLQDLEIIFVLTNVVIVIMIIKKVPRQTGMLRQRSLCRNGIKRRLI